jgi:hypothetical protein
MIVIVLIVVTALGGMAWSFFSRQERTRATPPASSRATCRPRNAGRGQDKARRSASADFCPGTK